MKKALNLAFFYAILGLLSGLFYREYTKIAGFEGDTMLSVVHTHTLSMGMLFMLIVFILYRLFDLKEMKVMKHFLLLYTIGFIWTLIMMFVRGISEVEMMDLSKGADAGIAGMAGLGHIILSIGLIHLFIGLKKAIKQE